MTVKARTERNFRRAKVKPARRSRFRWLMSWTLARRAACVALLALTVHQALVFIFTTPLLRVERIAVKGNVRLSTGQVQALVEDLRGTNILRADLDVLRQRLVDAPWVQDVALRRVLPSTIEVFVSERRPVGLCRLGEELFLVDETGTVIDQFGPQYAEFDLPIIDGLVAAPGGMHATIDGGRAEFAARVIAALGRNSEVAARLSQVDVTDTEDAVVLLEGDSALLHLGSDRFLERVQSYLELAGALRENVAEIDYVDLRFDRRVYVGPAADGGRGPKRQPPRPQGTRQF